MSQDTFRPNEGYFDGVNKRNHTLQIKTSILAQAINAGSSATKIPTVPISNRRALLMYNNSDAIIYIGDSTITTSTGYPLQIQDSLRIDIADNVDIYAISVAGGKELRILEGS